MSDLLAQSLSPENDAALSRLRGRGVMIQVQPLGLMLHALRELLGDERWTLVVQGWNDELAANIAEAEREITKAKLLSGNGIIHPK